MLIIFRGRLQKRLLLGLSAVGALGIGTALAQQPRAKSNPGKATATRPARDNQGEFALQPERVLVSPNDPAATVNGEVITRQRLADECIARKGQEILETLIARTMIDQAMRAKKIEVKASEVDAEIERVAQATAGVNRETWLRTLDKEKGISPVQYARDIIYPVLALRKLAAPRVQVTQEDLRDAYEATYGEKLMFRVIMVSRLDHAKAIWALLKKNPDSFEKIAREDPRSIDQGSKALGGMVAVPLTRHAEPRKVSDTAFRELVDGDPKDDPKNKPKDGDFTGVIQVSEANWVILRRESVEPAKPYDRNDPKLKEQLKDLMYEAKIKEEVGKVYQDLARKAAIENKLSGQVHLANEEEMPEHRVDGKVERMSHPDKDIDTKVTQPRSTSSKVSSEGKVKTPPAPKLTPAPAAGSK